MQYSSDNVNNKLEAEMADSQTVRVNGGVSVDGHLVVKSNIGYGVYVPAECSLVHESVIADVVKDEEQAAKLRDIIIKGKADLK